MNFPYFWRKSEPEPEPDTRSAEVTRAVEEVVEQLKSANSTLEEALRQYRGH